MFLRGTIAAAAIAMLEIAAVAQEGAATGAAGGAATSPGVGVTDTSGAIAPVPGTTSAGTPTPPATTEAAPVPVTIPGAYGTSPTTVTPGSGRFSQPKFKFTVNLSNGYDDNIYTTPKHPAKVSDAIVLGPSGEPLPKQPKPLEKTGSVVSQGSLSVQWQGANPRTVYALDGTIGAAYYWNRPVSPLEYNGAVSLIFLHKLTPRISISTSSRLAYSPQPDFSRIDSPTRIGTGSYITADTKVDLSYQWTARISGVLSGAVNGTFYNNSTAKGSNVINTTLGLQGRYLWTPRTATVLEARTSQDFHPNVRSADSTSQFFLFGADYTLSRRISATIRLGEQLRLFNNSGGSGQQSPYAETTLIYAYGKGSTLSWNNRFGLEDTGNSGTKTVSYRTGLQVTQVLSARLTAGAGVNYNRRTSSFLDNNQAKDIAENQFSLALSLRYVFTPNLSFSLSCNVDDVISSVTTTDYIRTRTFAGVDYAF